MVEVVESCATQWDGVERCKHILYSHFVCDSTSAGQLSKDPDPYRQSVSTLCCAGWIARALVPGLKLDQMPVLWGPQGVGKSRFVEWMLPRGLRSTYGALKLSGNPKQMLEAIQGKTLVEAGEMGDYSRRDVETLKIWLTTTQDNTVRKAYRRNPDSHARRVFIIGTSNREDSLPPDAENRRFAPVEVPHAHGAVEDFLDAHREQLIAEAAYKFRCRHGLWRDGERPSHLPDLGMDRLWPAMPRHLLPELRQRNKAKHTQVDEVFANLILDLGIDAGRWKAFEEIWRGVVEKLQPKVRSGSEPAEPVLIHRPPSGAERARLIGALLFHGFHSPAFSVPIPA